MSQLMTIFLLLMSNCHDVIPSYSTKCLYSYYNDISPFLIPIILIAACWFIVPRLLKYEKTKKSWRWISENFKWCFGTVFFSGFILYFIGYSHNIEGNNYLTYILSTFQAGGRALLSSLSMFVFETDLIEVGAAYHHNIIYLSLFALVHFLGVLISTHFIFRLLGTRLISIINISNLLKSEKKSNDLKELFIFWGINDESITLGKSIFNFNKDKGTLKKMKLIFVETPSEKELEIKEYSFSQLLSSSIHNNSDEDNIKEIDGISLYPQRRLVEVEKEYPGKDAIIFKKLGLSKLFELCTLPNNIYFFFLSDDEQKNIQDTLIIQEVFKGKVTDNKLHLYCKSRDNYANRAIINAEGLFITKLIDDAALSITTLKELKNKNRDYIAHPVNFVNPDKDKGVARNPFTALIIGFGTAGQDALRFLYEYGTFLKSPGVESPFKCYIIDKNINNIKGQFLREVPVLGSNEKPDSMKNIEFWNYDWNSDGFKEKFTNEILDELNYVVITTGEDKSNMTIAAELYEYTLKNRKAGVHNFHIFVRVYDKENEKQMEAVSNFYKRNDNNDKKITVFGKQCDIYTYKNIINDEGKEEKGKHFFETYLRVAGYKDTWEEREQRIKGKDTKYKDRLKDIHQREQDYSNVLHAYTKLKLCKYMEEDMPSMNEFSFDIESYPKEEKQRMTCYRNLSELEHIRWNAAHYMAGFVYAEDKDFRKKTHPCLKLFKDLEPTSSKKEDDRLKDYATVITTIELKKRNKCL